MKTAQQMASPLYPGTNNLLLVLVVAATMILQHSTAAEGSDNSSSLAKLGCRDSCGNVSIPYPFGIGKGCFMEGFEVHCSLDNISILETSGTPLLEINLALGEARVQNYIARACDTTKLGPDMSAFLPVRRSFMVSRTKNIFTAIGCSTIAYISGDVKTPIEEEGNNTFYSVNACGSFCNEDSVDSSTDCSGRGCCQSSIPRNLKSFVPAFLPNTNSSPQSFSPCSYAFVAEVDWFKFDPSYVTSPHIEYLFGFGPPLVLDWVFGSAPCEADAMKNGTSACAATNSVCVDVPSGCWGSALQRSGLCTK